MTIRFSHRVAFVNEGTERFLTIVVRLGGYCTIEQAQEMGLAKSQSQTQTELNGLERAGFLRRITEYPVVYQTTKSAARLIGTDSRARRSHAIHQVRWRLATVSFYLEARKWPADFIFGHDEKIVAFGKVGCPRATLPHRGGQPYLWEDFILDPPGGGLCVAIVDRPHWTPFLQLQRFVKRYATCRTRAGERLSLVVAVGSEARLRLYEGAARHRKVIEHSKGATEPASLYQVSTPTPPIRILTHQPAIHTNLDSRRP